MKNNQIFAQLSFFIVYLLICKVASERVSSKYYNIVYKSLEKKFYVEERVTYSISIPSKQPKDFPGQGTAKASIFDMLYFDQPMLKIKQYFGYEYSNLLVQGKNIVRVKLEEENSFRTATIEFLYDKKNKESNMREESHEGYGIKSTTIKEGKKDEDSQKSDLNSISYSVNTLVKEREKQRRGNNNKGIDGNSNKKAKDTVDILITYSYTINKEIRNLNLLSKNLKVSRLDRNKDHHKARNLLEDLNLGLLAREEDSFLVNIDLKIILNDSFNSPKPLKPSIQLSPEKEKEPTNNSDKGPHTDKNTTALHPSSPKTFVSSEQNNSSLLKPLVTPLNTLSSKNIENTASEVYSVRPHFSTVELCYQDFIGDLIILETQEPKQDPNDQYTVSLQFRNIRIYPGLYQYFHLVSKSAKMYHRQLEQSIMSKYYYSYMTIIGVYFVILYLISFIIFKATDKAKSKYPEQEKIVLEQDDL